MTAEVRAKTIIIELNAMACEVDSYDYGLPIYNDEAMPQLVAAVADAIRAAVAEEREECAKIAAQEMRRATRDLEGDPMLAARDAAAMIVRHIRERGV